MPNVTKETLAGTIDAALRKTPLTDVHTHLFSTAFGEMLLWGIDELITYHYLVAETFRYVDLGYEEFFALPKRAQADLVWKTLFLEHSPVSEAQRGVLTVLARLGLDPGTRDLAAYRRHVEDMGVEKYVDHVFALANIKEVVMTNDPFHPEEREYWLAGAHRDDRFKAALRLDALLNGYDESWRSLRAWGYHVGKRLDGTGTDEIRRFLREWCSLMKPLYMAVSLPPSFRVPEDSVRSRLITECVLPVCEEINIPFAMMIGVTKRVNDKLGDAGDAVAKADIRTVEYLCDVYPRNKFMVTMLARENQHELCVCARKFRNLLVFGCWWFLNNPSIVDEMTRMRTELLGLSYVPQHSDARVLDQLVYKWDHSKRTIAGVLRDKYADLLDTGWKVSVAEIERDVADLLGGNFRSFIAKKF